MSECRSDESWEDDGGLLRQEEPARVYDLEERTAKFGEAVIRILKTVPQGPLTNRLIDQLVGCATSMGANYAEADDGVSIKDFRNRIISSACWPLPRQLTQPSAARYFVKPAN